MTLNAFGILSEDDGNNVLALLLSLHFERVSVDKYPSSETAFSFQVLLL